MLVYHCDELLSLRYTDLDFHRDSCKSTVDFVFTLSGGSVSWKSVKESCITNFAMEVEYVATFEVAKKATWLQKFLLGLGVVHLAISPLVLFCDNNGVVTQFKELRNHQNSKHIKKKKYHLIRKLVLRKDVVMEQISSVENLMDPFMKTLFTKVFDGHGDNLGVRYILSMPQDQ